ncbi:MAG: ABC transporter substrate-binding protein, partial [Thermoplasmata archaeon]|nr:ABC transporter substrate-binding protein [Thermoplasmata archaeon]
MFPLENDTNLCTEDSSEESKPRSTAGDLIRMCVSVFIMSMFLMTAIQVTLTGSVMAADQDRVLTLGMQEAMTSANPYIGLFDADYLFYSYVYDYMMYPNEDGIYTPNLAKEWWFMDGPTAATSGSDFNAIGHNATPADWPLGSIWEYNLTDAAYWSDGVPFNADDVLFTISIQIGATFNSYWAYQPYTRWIDYIEKIDDYKVRIYYADYDSKYPIPASWGYSLSIPIMPKHAFEGKPNTWIGQEWDGYPPIGTGPFTGTANIRNEIIQGESVTLVKNQFYDFMEDGVRKGVGGYYNRTNEMDKLVMKFYAEEQTLVLDLKTGKLDATEVGASDYLAMSEDPSLSENVSLISIFTCTVYTKISHWNVYSDAPGEQHPARLDPALHRAAAIAIDKDYITNATFKGLGKPGYHIISPVYPEWYWEPGDDEMSYFNVTDKDGNVVYSYN